MLKICLSQEFYDQKDFNAYQRLKIMKAIIELTDSSGGSGIIENRSDWRKGFEESAMIFYKRDG